MVDFLFILFFAIQWHLTLFGGFCWPFSSHRLFSQLPSIGHRRRDYRRATKKIIQIVVTDESGRGYTVHPGQVIPLEYSRCTGLIRRIYYNGTLLQKKLLHEYMLDAINNHPWSSFDEMFSSIKSTSKFISLSIEEHTVSLAENLPVVDKKIIYPSDTPIMTASANRTVSTQTGSAMIVYWSVVAVVAGLCLINNTNFISIDQTRANERADMLQALVCMVILVLLWHSPYSRGQFYTKNQFLFTWHGVLYLPHQCYRILIMITSIAAVLFGLRFAERISGLILTFGWWYLQYYSTQFSTTYWITNTHTNWIILWLTISAFCDIPSIVLTFTMLYVSTLYLQAGVSKLLLGGIEWFTTGRRVYMETLILGTAFGKWLVPHCQWIFRLFGYGTAVVELIVPFLLFNPVLAPWAALTLFLFHMGTYSVLGISFWFLWILYPAIYLK